MRYLKQPLCDAADQVDFLNLLFILSAFVTLLEKASIAFVYIRVCTNNIATKTVQHNCLP